LDPRGELPSRLLSLSLSLSLPFSSLRAPSPSPLHARPCPGAARPCSRRRSPLPPPAATPAPAPPRRDPAPAPPRRRRGPPAPAPPRGGAPRPQRGPPAPAPPQGGGLALGAVPGPYARPRPLRAASRPSAWLAWPRHGLVLPRLPLTRSRVRNPTRAVIILGF
jgi:translation initiation factor IF-2